MKRFLRDGGVSMLPTCFDAAESNVLHEDKRASIRITGIAVEATTAYRMERAALRERREICDGLKREDRLSCSPGSHEREEDAAPSSPVQFDRYGFSIERGERGRVLVFSPDSGLSSGPGSYLARGWARYLDQVSSHGQVARTRELKLLVRAGVPPPFRGPLWKAFSRMSERRSEYPPSHYRHLLEGEAFSRPSRDTAEIDKDVRRTFPGHRLFQTEPAIKALRRVLVAHSLHNPRVGYCQSLNFVCAILLLFVDEEDAFWYMPAFPLSHTHTHARSHEHTHSISLSHSVSLTLTPLLPLPRSLFP